MLSVVIITGLSGAGKSTAAKALEDQGYYTIDNMPLMLIEKFVNIFFDIGIDTKKIALVIDTRAGDSKQAFAVISMLKEKYGAKVIFLTASLDILVNRYQASRRKHPLGLDVVEAVNLEDSMMSDIKTISDLIIDTTSMNVHELTAQLVDFSINWGSEREMLITLNSFGFKYGVPTDSDLVFDVRFVRNPHFVDSMRERTGKEIDVSDFVFNDPVAGEFFNKLADMLLFLIPQYQNEGKRYLKISVGCTGGRHRSVAFVEKMYLFLETHGIKSSIRHRDMERH